MQDFWDLSMIQFPKSEDVVEKTYAIGKQAFMLLGRKRVPGNLSSASSGGNVRGGVFNDSTNHNNSNSSPNDSGANEMDDVTRTRNLQKLLRQRQRRNPLRRHVKERGKPR